MTAEREIEKQYATDRPRRATGRATRGTKSGTTRGTTRLGRWSAVLAVTMAVTTVGLTQSAHASPVAACGLPPVSKLRASTTSAVYQTLTVTLPQSACTWTVPPGVRSADVLVVAGGGQAGAGSNSGAGGAGGLIYRAAGIGNSQVALTAGDVIPIEVGTGGNVPAGLRVTAVGDGVDGTNSSFGTTLVAIGGGGGGGEGFDGHAGGSGGGGGRSTGAPTQGGAGTLGQGNSGAATSSCSLTGGGGGGSGGVASGATGGNGSSIPISGTATDYAEGGTVRVVVTASCVADSAARKDFHQATPTRPYGSGGDANGTAAGGNGIVIVRYLVPPSAPTSPTAVGGNAQATVSFAPSTTGAPTSYTVRVAAPGDTSKTCTVPVATLTSRAGRSGRLKAATPVQLSCTVPGLTNGSSYLFEVKADNGSDSLWSAPSPLITLTADSQPSAPNAPTTVTAVAGTASVTASWTAVAGATGYTATAQPGPATCTTTGPTTCVLGAVAGTSYTVTVVARSGNGTSNASSASNAVTPTEPAIPPAVPSTAPITLTTDKGQISLATPGQQITVLGTGFAPYSTATVILYSTPIDLGNVTTDGAGSFSVPVTVPADLANGKHTFLATGINPSGGTRQMALPVTVARTDGGSTGGGTGTGTLPVPAGGGITLLDAAGLPTTSVIVAEGTYALDATTGIITFVPVAGFIGTAASVAYRITDALGTVVNGSYTAVVTAPAPPSAPIGKPTVKLPTRIISSTGSSSTAPASCRISKGSIAKCTITVTAVVSKRTVVVGKGSITTKAGQTLNKVTVKAALNALGRSLAARPGGARFTFTGVVTQRGRTGSTTATGTTTVLAAKYTLPRSIYFGSDSATVRSTDTTYLKAVRAKLAGATSITCTGHADSRGSAKAARTLGTRRARAACAVLSKNRKVTVHTVSKGEKAPIGKNNTTAGRAHNRRVDIVVHN
jgi:CshA-type fibril repeat protein